MAVVSMETSLFTLWALTPHDDTGYIILIVCKMGVDVLFSAKIVLELANPNATKPQGDSNSGVRQGDAFRN